MKQDFPFRKIMLPNGICLYANKWVPKESTGQPLRQRPLLFVHGMWSDAAVFQHWLKQAEDMGIPAYAIDLRGHGNSTSFKLAEAGIAEYVQDVMDVMSYIGRCTLVGHSMGALISQIVAYKHTWVEKLILVTSAPPAGIPLRGPILLKIWKYIPSILGKQPFVMTVNDLRDLAFNQGFTRDDQDQYMSQLVLESGKAARDISFFLWNAWVKPVRRCDTFVIGGGEDRLTPPSIQQAIAHKHRAHYEVIPGACHMIQLQPEVREASFKKIVSWAN